MQYKENTQQSNIQSIINLGTKIDLKNIKKAMKVLNIDDSTVNNMLMEDMLTMHGYDVNSVIKGTEVMEKLEKYHPDVILLDLMIPDKSGIEILKELRSQNIDIPVIVITAMRSNEIEEKLKKLGISGYFQKPIKSNELIQSIQEAAKIS